MVHLKDEKVVNASRKCWGRLQTISNNMRKGVPMENDDIINVRVLLAAYMIVHRTACVFESMDSTLEQKVLQSGIEMLKNTESLIAFISRQGKHFAWAKVSQEMMTTFAESIRQYKDDFKKWRMMDETKLLLRIKNALYALYQAMRHLPTQDLTTADQRLAQEFNVQIARLRSKIVQISGQEALSALDEEMQRPLVPSGEVAHSFVLLGSGSRMISRQQENEPLRNNEPLAHELLINPHFQLREDGSHTESTSTTVRMRALFHASFWNAIKDDLTRVSPPCYTRVFRVLKEIQDGFKDLAGSLFAETAMGVLDVGHIQFHVQHGTFSWSDSHNLIASAVSFIRMVEAPHRSEETQSQWEETLRVMEEAETEEAQAYAFVDGLQLLSRRMHLCRIDAANTRLRLMGPMMQAHGIMYEMEKYKTGVENGTILTEKTVAWLECQQGESTPSRFYAKAFLSLFIPQLESNIPETLRFDVDRFVFLHQEFHLLVTIRLVLLVFPELTLLNETSDRESVDGIIKELMANSSETLRARLEMVLERDSTSRTLLNQRIQQHLFLKVAGLPDSTIQLFETVDTTNQEIKKKLTDRFARLVKTICRVAEVDWHVHSQFYLEIIQDRHLCPTV